MRDFIDMAIDQELMHFATIAGMSGAGFALEAALQHRDRKIAELEALRGNPTAISQWIKKCNMRDAEWQAIWRAPKEQRQALRAAYDRRWP